MAVISGDMVAIAQPSIPCKRLFPVVLLSIDVDGPVQIETELAGVVPVSVTLQGMWQRCPKLDNTVINNE